MATLGAFAAGGGRAGSPSARSVPRIFASATSSTSTSSPLAGTAAGSGGAAANHSGSLSSSSASSTSFSPATSSSSPSFAAGKDAGEAAYFVDHTGSQLQYAIRESFVLSVCQIEHEGWMIKRPVKGLGSDKKRCVRARVSE
jgi:hypothetical protein